MAENFNPFMFSEIKYMIISTEDWMKVQKDYKDLKEKYDTLLFNYEHEVTELKTTIEDLTKELKDYKDKSILSPDYEIMYRNLYNYNTYLEEKLRIANREY